MNDQNEGQVAGSSPAMRTIFPIIQTSPGLTTGIVILHPVEHHRTIQRRLIAQFDVLVLCRDFEQALADEPQLGFGQLRQFVDDFYRAHRAII
jgi:hypothetical protein